MKTILELLRKHIENIDYSIYSFSKRSKINRTTLQKILSGDRTLTKENLAQIVQHLNLAPHELVDIENAFLIYSIGNDRYRNRMYIKDFLEWHSPTYLSYPNTSVAIHSLKNSIAIIPEDSSIITGQTALVQVIYFLLKQSASDTPYLYSYSPFKTEFYGKLVQMLQHVPNKELTLKHLIMIDKATNDPDGIFHNLQVLTSLVPYVMQSYQASSIRYFYGNLSSYRLDGIIFPYYIILEQCILLINADFDKGLYLSKPDVHNLYLEQFSKLYEGSHSLTRKSIANEENLNYMIENFTPSESRYCIEYQPCFPAVTEQDLLEHIIRADLKNRKAVIDQLMLRKKQLNQQHSLYLFTREGLELFARNGICQKIVPAFADPIAPEHRIKMLQKLLSSNQGVQQQYIMLNENRLNLNPNFTLSIEYPNSIYTEIKDEDSHSSRFCIVRENTLYNAFLDFLTNTKQHSFTVSLEETNTYIQQLIDELKEL